MFSSLSPVRLRQLLSSSLLLIMIICGATLYFATSGLSQVATEVSHSTSDAQASNNNIQTLQNIKLQLEKQQDAIKRSGLVLIDTTSYAYQNQIVDTLNAYARRWKVELADIAFTDPSANAAATPVKVGPKSIDASVSIKGPTDYNSLLNFINSINHNLTKMQIARISLSKSDSGAGISSDIINISIYVQ